jgi:hypothetical protein
LRKYGAGPVGGKIVHGDQFPRGKRLAEQGLQRSREMAGLVAYREED